MRDAGCEFRDVQDAPGGVAHVPWARRASSPTAIIVMALSAGVTPCRTEVQRQKGRGRATGWPLSGERIAGVESSHPRGQAPTHRGSVGRWPGSRHPIAGVQPADSRYTAAVWRGCHAKVPPSDERIAGVQPPDSRGAVTGWPGYFHQMAGVFAQKSPFFSQKSPPSLIALEGHKRPEGREGRTCRPYRNSLWTS